MSETTTRTLATLVIRSSEWGRGRSPSYLRNPRTGRMCCLGILGRACGIAEDRLDYYVGPRSQSEAYPQDIDRWPFDSLVPQSSLIDLVTGVEQAIDLNDDEGDLVSDDDDRIEQLRPIFREWGFELDFRPDE